MASLRLELPAPVAGRVGALDELKGVAILMIVFYHAGGVLGFSSDPHGEIGVDIFVILSGIGLVLAPGATGTLRFLGRRFWRIYPSYWIVLSALLVADALVLDRRYSTGDIALHYLGIHGWFGDRLALSINDSFWFITLIVTLYLLFAVLRRFLGRPDQLLFWGFLASLALAVYDYRARRLIGFDHISLRIPGFFLGLVAGRLLKEGRLELPLSGALGAAAVLLLYAPYTQNFVFASVWVGAGLMAGYAFLVRPWLGAETRGILGFLGVRSLGIFLIHQPLIRDYNLWAQRRLFPGSEPTSLALAVGIVVGLAVAIALSDRLHGLLAKVPAGATGPAPRPAG
jgi:peptidoglycan/LPS O-acetylase OafA/YrhL